MVDPVEGAGNRVNRVFTGAQLAHGRRDLALLQRRPGRSGPGVERSQRGAATPEGFWRSFPCRDVMAARPPPVASASAVHGSGRTAARWAASPSLDL